MSENQKKPGLSRRGFLKGAGLTAAGSVVVPALGNGTPWTFNSPGEMIGPDATQVELSVNGHVRAVMAEPRTTLASALRDLLDLTGTKVVCDRGSCSACTVWLDGKPVNSCMVLAFDARGKEITTIEGLATNGELHPVQEAFIEHDATQCGYCTPGMVMSCAHLLETTPDPTLDDVKMATRGNLCRCGTHPHVFKATLDAATKMK